MYQFCSRACSDDYKKLHCIVTYCEYCQEEKTLHETVNFSGIKRPFCSEGMYVFKLGFFWLVCLPGLLVIVVLLQLTYCTGIQC